MNQYNILTELYGEYEKPLYLHNLILDKQDKDNILEEVRKGDITIGKQIGELQNNLTVYFQKEKLNIGLLNSGTSALHLSLTSLNIKSGDDILISPITFIAPVNTIHYTGASPFFIDIDADTLTMSPKILSNFIENHTTQKNGKLINDISGNEIKGLIHVDVFGQIGRLDEIYKICKEYDIYCIEDAAESFGSKLNNSNIGQYCDLVAGSFNGNKIISGGGGGFVGSKNSEIIEEISHISNQSRYGNEWEYDHDKIGYNYRITNLQSALINSQLNRLDDILSKKRDLHEYYKKYFSDKNLHLYDEKGSNQSNYWLNAIYFDLSEKEVEDIISKLNSDGIKSRKMWKIMTEIEHNKKESNSGNLTQSKKVSEKIINIPSGLDVYEKILG